MGRYERDEVVGEEDVAAASAGVVGFGHVAFESGMNMVRHSVFLDCHHR